MYGSEFCTFSFWWMVPLLMMLVCFFMMRRRWGTTMCGFGKRGRGWPATNGTESAMEILDKRYASGDIEKAEYEEKKRMLATQSKNGS